jgi:hypothetical protein
MKKLIVPTICALVGCAAGVAVPAITAQSFSPPSAETQRWDQFCEANGSRRGMNAALAENARARGQEGFELVSTTLGWETIMACYKRPAH